MGRRGSNTGLRRRATRVGQWCLAPALDLVLCAEVARWTWILRVNELGLLGRGGIVVRLLVGGDRMVGPTAPRRKGRTTTTAMAQVAAARRRSVVEPRKAARQLPAEGCYRHPHPRQLHHRPSSRQRARRISSKSSPLLHTEALAFGRHLDPRRRRESGLSPRRCSTWALLRLELRPLRPRRRRQDTPQLHRPYRKQQYRRVGKVKPLASATTVSSCTMTAVGNEVAMQGRWVTSRWSQRLASRDAMSLLRRRMEHGQALFQVRRASTAKQWRLAGPRRRPI